ncbi:MAG: RMD1 family protein [Myxococcales bacterium]|nr:RMD1 family protein [Myxococcales bacterium]
MAQLPILAYGFATAFRPRDLVPCFVGATVRTTKTSIVAEYAPDRFAVGFAFGAVVFLNVVAEERTRVIGAILGSVARDEPHPPLEEDFLVEVAEGVPPRGEVRFDRVLLPGLTSATVELIALLLAQSVSIDYYDEDLREILAAVSVRTDRLAKTGRIGESTRALSRFVGTAISAKNQIVSAVSLLDKPASTWEVEPLDRLHHDLREMLEIEERFRALEYKLRTIQETLELFLDLAQTRRSHLLEATIVALIVVELLLPVVRPWLLE